MSHRGMDGNLDPRRPYTGPSSSRDTHRDRIKREEKQKRFYLAKRHCDIFKDRLQAIPHALSNLEETFKRDSSQVHTLQEIADDTLRRFQAISPIGLFIDAVMAARNHEQNMHSHGAFQDILPRHAMFFQYLEGKGLDPSHFGDIVNIIENNTLTPRDVARLVRESVGLKRVIDTQNQVYDYMSNAISNYRQGLQSLPSWYGNHDSFLQQVEEFCLIYDSHRLGDPQLNESGQDREIRLHPLYRVADLADPIKINSEVNRETFLQIKHQNWETFTNDVSLIRRKTYDTQLGMSDIFATFH